MKEVLYQHPERSFYLDKKTDYYIYQTPDMVAVLPVLPNGDILLIEQYRPPINKRIVELVTGGIRDGEDSEIAAQREVREETGYNVDRVEKAGSYYSAPGYITQHAHVFVAYLKDFEQDALEEHELEFGLKPVVIKKEDAESFVRGRDSHPYLEIALRFAGYLK